MLTDCCQKVLSWQQQQQKYSDTNIGDHKILGFGNDGADEISGFEDD